MVSMEILSDTFERGKKSIIKRNPSEVQLLVGVQSGLKMIPKKVRKMSVCHVNSYLLIQPKGHTWHTGLKPRWVLKSSVLCFMSDPVTPSSSRNLCAKMLSVEPKDI